MLLFLVGSARAAVLFGGAWSPAGIGMFAWDDADKFSGTLAGEFDGLLRPPLTAHGGWVGSRDAVLGNLSLVQLNTTRFAASNAVSAVGGVRLGVDYRRYLWSREGGAVNFYGDLGGFGIVPNAAETDGAYTTDEQADADEGAAENRARVGGFGAQGGLGAEYLFADAKGRPAVAVGVRWLVRGYRGQEGDEDEGFRVSTVVMSEAALVVELCR
ncbi:MAG: hypothetical protein Q8P41_19835 [Pseudomonadota bacterium]|nr:hypothetical protein [Pseudomonadota bacterium]